MGKSKSWFNHMCWFDLSTRFDLESCDFILIWIYNHLICDLNKSQISVTRADWSWMWCSVTFADSHMPIGIASSIPKTHMQQKLSAFCIIFWFFRKIWLLHVFSEKLLKFYKLKTVLKLWFDLKLGQKDLNLFVQRFVIRHQIWSEICPPLIIIMITIITYACNICGVPKNVHKFTRKKSTDSCITTGLCN